MPFEEFSSPTGRGVARWSPVRSRTGVPREVDTEPRKCSNRRSPLGRYDATLLGRSPPCLLLREVARRLGPLWSEVGQVSAYPHRETGQSLLQERANPLGDIGRLAQHIDALGVEAVRFPGRIGAEHAPHQLTRGSNRNGGGIVSDLSGERVRGWQQLVG